MLSDRHLVLHFAHGNGQMQTGSTAADVGQDHGPIDGRSRKVGKGRVILRWRWRIQIDRPYAVREEYLAGSATSTSDGVIRPVPFQWPDRSGNVRDARDRGPDG